MHDEDSSDESTFESDESGGPHGEREGSSKLTPAGTVFWVGGTAVVTPLRERDISSKVSLKESKSGRLEGLIWKSFETNAYCILPNFKSSSILFKSSKTNKMCHHN